MRFDTAALTPNVMAYASSEHTSGVRKVVQVYKYIYLMVLGDIVSHHKTLEMVRKATRSLVQGHQQIANIWTANCIWFVVSSGCPMSPCDMLVWTERGLNRYDINMLLVHCHNPLALRLVHNGIWLARGYAVCEISNCGKTTSSQQ